MELDLLEEGWVEIGRSLAEAVVDGKKTFAWAWDLLSPLHCYRPWMLKEWIQRYKEQSEKIKAKKLNKKKTPKRDESVFKKKEQIAMALKLLSQGHDQLECLEIVRKLNSDG